jgi:hypothetical protein
VSMVLAGSIVMDDAASATHGANEARAPGREQPLMAAIGTHADRFE